MKNYAKVGKRPGRPAYRTPSSFKIRKAISIQAGKRGKS
jgi:hypothetical protein